MLQFAVKRFLRAISAKPFLAVLLLVVQGHVAILPVKETEPEEVFPRSSFLYTLEDVLGSRSCDDCFANRHSLICHQTYRNCSMHYSSAPMTEDLSPEIKSALITSCTRNISAADSGSVLCSGLQALQVCLAESHLRKCVAFDRQLAAATGIIIQFTRDIMNLYIRMKFKDRFHGWAGKNMKRTNTYWHKSTISKNGQLMSLNIPSTDELQNTPRKNIFIHNEFVVGVAVEDQNLVPPSDVASQSTGQENNSEVSISGTSSDGEPGFRLSPPPPPPGNKGPNRRPLAMNITVRGPGRNRKEIIDRAIKILQNRGDFKKFFRPKITVTTDKNNKSLHIVRFETYNEWVLI